AFRAIVRRPVSSARQKPRPVRARTEAPGPQPARQEASGKIREEEKAQGQQGQAKAGEEDRQIETRQIMDSMTPATKVWTRETGVTEKRDVWTSIKRGFRGRCPRCGRGKLFRAYLKVDNNCSVCGLDFTPHRADDLPAYLVIVIVG